MTLPSVRRLWPRLFLPFAAGYFLSYLYRTANAVIGPVLAREMSLGDSALGLLTSTYFLAFGAAQLPLGILLDRFGPRRVEAGLLLLAATGAFSFALSGGLGGLALSRALIGLGVSACLMASLKAFAQWFSAEQQASLIGWIMASGGLGALAASKPLELALGFATWREIMFGLAGATLTVTTVIWFVVPDKEGEARTTGFADQLAGVKIVFSSPHFWRYAPLGFWFGGGFMAVQGLWVSRWLSVMENLDGAMIAARLTWLNGTILAGFLCMGIFSTRLVRRGIKLEWIYGGGMVAAVALLGLISSRPAMAGSLLWPALGLGFALSHLSFALVAQAFPPVLSGRATTAFNLMMFAGAFGLQWGIGGLVDALQARGWVQEEAYRVAFFTLAGGQLLSVGWFLVAGRRRTLGGGTGHQDE